MAKLRNVAASNIKRYGVGKTTGDQSLGGAYAKNGHVAYMSPEDARKRAGYGTLLDKIGVVAPYGVMGLMGYGALTGGTGSLSALAHGGASAGASGASGASGLGADVASTMAVPGTVGTSSLAAGPLALAPALPKAINVANETMAPTKSGGVTGFFNKLKSMGLDPTTLGLGAMSLLQGNPNQQRHSYGDQTKQLTQRGDDIQSLINQLRAQPDFVQHDPIAPVTIPGLPFQIGGGLGTNPATPLADPTKAKLRTP